MATVTVEDYCGSVHEIECSDEVARILTAREPEDRAVPFSVLMAPHAVDGPDLAEQQWLSNELRLYYRGQLARADQSSWEGPVLTFPVLLGIGRQWSGPYRVDPCPFCRGVHLQSYEYCIGCDRSGCDYKIDMPTRDVRRKCRRAEAARRGRRRSRLKGGRG